MTKSVKNGMRRGFTLIEVAVVLILLSLLAAFVMPDVIKHIDDADPTRVEVDLRSIQNALDSWYIDNRRVMPGDLEDLIHKPVVGTDLGILSNAYTGPDTLRWDGPYLRVALAASGASANDSIPTAFSGWIQNDLTLLDFATSTVSGLDEVGATTCSAKTWVTIKITGLAVSEFERINDILDGTDETDGAVSQASGNLRRLSANATTYYLVKPCRGASS